MIDICLDFCLEMSHSSLIAVYLLASFSSVIELVWLVMFCQPATLNLVIHLYVT